MLYVSKCTFFGEASSHHSMKMLYLGACKSLQNFFSLFHPKIALAYLSATVSCTHTNNGSCANPQAETIARAQFLLHFRTINCQVHKIKVMICNGIVIFSSVAAITECCTQLSVYLTQNLSDTCHQMFILLTNIKI